MERFSFPGGKGGWWRSQEAEGLLGRERVLGWVPEFGDAGKVGGGEGGGKAVGMGEERMGGDDAAFANDDGKT